MRTLFLAIILSIIFVSDLEARCHIYLFPALGTGVGTDPRRPKYQPAGVKVHGIYYGAQGFYIVALDVTNPADTTISGDSEVMKIPDNLDNAVGAALTTVRGALEAREIPGGWVTSGMTYRTVLRTVINIFGFVQRLTIVGRLSQALLSGSVTLDTQFNSLSVGVRQKLLDTADSWGLDTSGLTGSATLRQILKNVADQRGVVRPISLGCATI